jgi:hypothetical protein
MKYPVEAIRSVGWVRRWDCGGISGFGVRGLRRKKGGKGKGERERGK